MGSLGGMDCKSPRNVVMTASLNVWYHVSTPGKNMTLGL